MAAASLSLARWRMRSTDGDDAADCPTAGLTGANGQCCRIAVGS